jgi:hypothetical protein
MAYGNKLLSIDALLAAWQNRNQMEGNSAQNAMQQKMVEKQLEAQQLANEQAKWNLLKEKTRPTMTVPSSGLSGMPHKIFLDEAAGYIGGVSPTDTFNQWNQNFRQGMASGGGGGGYGGRGRGEEQQSQSESPYNYEGPDHSIQKDSVGIASRLAELYGRGTNGGLGGGAVSNASTFGDTYKSFSENPVMDSGKIVDANGNETITGPTPAADYQAGLAGKAEVDAILREREELPGKQAAAKAQVLNNVAKLISSDPRFGNLSDKIQAAILSNIGTIVEDNIKTKGTPLVDVGDIISRYTKPQAK